MWFRSAVAPPDAASRLCRGKEHGASGATAAADCGLPVGTAEICSATTARTTVGRRRWHLPGDRPQPYAVYVDDTDAVWVNDWGANAILSFDPKHERFESFLPDSYANVRQLTGRKGDVGGPNPRPAVQSKKPAPNDVNHWSSLHVRPSRSINAMAAEGPQLPAG